MSDEFDSSYLDDISQATTDITDIAYRLKRLSGAFFTVGNEKIGIELESMHYDLLDDQKRVNNAIGKEINRSLVSSQKSSELVVRAALAGALSERQSGDLL